MYLALTEENNYYNASQFGFGQVNYLDKKAQSAYFENYTTISGDDFQFTFATNAVGLGLPSEQYQNFSNSMNIVSNNTIVCT